MWRVRFSTKLTALSGRDRQRSLQWAASVLMQRSDFACFIPPPRRRWSASGQKAASQELTAVRDAIETAAMKEQSIEIL